MDQADIDLLIRANKGDTKNYIQGTLTPKSLLPYITDEVYQEDSKHANSPRSYKSWLVLSK